MKKQPLLAALRQSFPQFSKPQLYAKIMCGEVTMAGQRLRDPKQLVAAGAEFVLLKGRRYVSRGGDKLQKAVEEFGHWGFPLGFLARQVDEPIIVLDAGSSAGGFSDCLLQHGCNTVYAVDSGKNQLDFRLRQDPRVRSFEGYKIQNFVRDLPILGLELPHFVVMDISFRSILPLVAPTLAICQRRAGVFLCKPQFEWQTFCRVQPKYSGLHFNGIVADTLAYLVLHWFCRQLILAGIELVGHCPSPLRGGLSGTKSADYSSATNSPRGNLEFLLYCKLPGNRAQHL